MIQFRIISYLCYSWWIISRKEVSPTADLRELQSWRLMLIESRLKEAEEEFSGSSFLTPLFFSMRQLFYFTNSSHLGQEKHVFHTIFPLHWITVQFYTVSKSFIDNGRCFPHPLSHYRTAAVEFHPLNVVRRPWLRLCTSIIKCCTVQPVCKKAECWQKLLSVCVEVF